MSGAPGGSVRSLARPRPGHRRGSRPPPAPRRGLQVRDRVPHQYVRPSLARIRQHDRPRGHRVVPLGDPPHLPRPHHLHQARPLQQPHVIAGTPLREADPLGDLRDRRRLEAEYGHDPVTREVGHGAQLFVGADAKRLGKIIGRHASNGQRFLTIEQGDFRTPPGSPGVRTGECCRGGGPRRGPGLRPVGAHPGQQEGGAGRHHEGRVSRAAATEPRIPRLRG